MVKFYDMGSGQSLASYSGDYDASNMPAPVTSNSGKMMIVFMTNATNTDAGWEGSYSVVQTGIPDPSSAQKITLYPVPAHNQVSIEFSNDVYLPVRLDLISSTGKTVRSVSLKDEPASGIVHLDLQGIAPGLYFLQVTTDQETTTRKLLIN